MEKSINKTSGFTLLEVLVASTILIITISAMTLIYRTAVLSSTKASKNVQLYGNISLITNTIQNQIRGGNSTKSKSGENQINGTKYSWKSELIEKKGAPLRFNPDEGIWEEQPARFYLWKVYLTVENENLSKNYEYHELSWSSI